MSSRTEPEKVLRDSVIIEGKSGFNSSSFSPPSGLSFCTPSAQYNSSSSPCKTTGPQPTTRVYKPTPENGGLKLDLPVVYNNFKFSNFRGTTGVSFLVTKRRRQNEKTVLDSLSSLTIEDGHGPTGTPPTTAGIDEAVAALKKTRSPRRPKLFSGEQQQSNTKQKKDKDDDLWTSLSSIIAWAREHSLTREDQIERIAQDWGRFQTGEKVTGFKEIADLFSVTSEQLRNFDLDDCLNVKLTSLVAKLRHVISHYAFSDLMKMLSFREWQSSKGDSSKCAYYLSESHGTHFRSETVDKHCLFFCKKEEMAKESDPISPCPDERMRKKVFVRQIKDAITFGKKFEDFEVCLSEINPNWNIVQLTAMSFGCNRFGADLADFRVTPPLFLTSFLSVPGDAKRSSFVGFVKQARRDESARMSHGILEEFKKVMMKNLHINEDYDGCRKKYWDIRAEHNKHLSDILDAMEENWIGPYAALLPGNIKDASIQKMIVAALTEIQNILGPKTKMTGRVFLYKLVENYGILSSRTKLKLKEILAAVLPTTMKRSGLIVEVIHRVGRSIPNDMERWPTILVLDSELEQLPWDWVPSLRTTSVTRMPSIAAIYSALKVVRMSRPRYPEIVDISKCSYILNPDQSLTNVQKRLEPYLTGNKKWTGVIARKPTHTEMEEALQGSDAMLYCGHGSGIAFFPEFALQKLLCNAVPILMGCSSAQYRYNGPKANSSSIVTSYLIAACPSIVGFLWEVTDVECDRVTVDLVQRWLPGSKRIPKFPQFDPKLDRPREKCLATAVLRSRKAATQFLTEAALVNYGLPVETK